MSGAAGGLEGALLAEMVRESERVVDGQTRAFDRADDRSERLVALSIAVLGGGLTVSAFGLGRLSPRDTWFFGLAALALGLNFAALAQLLRAYLGVMEHLGFQAGVSPEWIAEKSREAAWDLRRHYLRALGGLADSYVENLAGLDRVARARRAGVKVLLCATAAYAAVLFHIAVKGSPA